MTPPLPGVPASSFTEREGVLQVAKTVNEARCLWREVMAHDVGIDGYIEYVGRDGATGHQVAVQVKTGDSYLRRSRKGKITFTPSERHRSYWERFYIPVILILVGPKEGVAYWVDARDQLRDGRSQIEIQTSTAYSTFNAKGVIRALECAGTLPWGALSIDGLVENLVCGETVNPRYEVTFLELFAHGMFNYGQSLYISTDLIDAVAKQNLRESTIGGDTAPDDADYDFLWNYLDWLSGSDLARIDHDAVLRDVMTCGQSICLTIAPLTERGRQLADYLSMVMVDRPAYREIANSKNLGWGSDVNLDSRRVEVLELKERLSREVFGADF
ncbi:DUF4365 domain-containing protein [Nocardioides sp. NPDC101246]|uniref:DUF4365 domain-containing protein n=1 Tax=Nocardioides sp. NPDC101246 TaxID=3364336 RepID=UPI0037F832C0